MLWDKVWLTIVLSLGSVFITWLIAFPIGIYSAVKQYSLGDYVFTFIGFIGIAVPGFLLALVLMYVRFKYFGETIGGLFSSEFVNAPWSMARMADFIQHIWIPVLILAFGGTAELIRIMRANLLDEMHKPYVITARCQGPSRVEGAAQVSGAPGAQSVCQHHRVDSALPGVRLDHSLGRDESADNRPDAAAGTCKSRTCIWLAL